MASEAERLLAGTGWLPELLRTPGLDAPALPFLVERENVGEVDDVPETLPAFLTEAAEAGAAGEHLMAAE